jgi:aspartyl-tRNA(Asn)/glutamyl-tRNA(Gln) amidotransferase subunit C
MVLNPEEVDHIAKLARLDLTDDEKTRFQEQLSAILEYAARLQEIDTTNIPPTSSVFPDRNVLRPDIPHPGLDLKELLSNAPQIEQTQFRVPLVLE